MEIWWWFMPTFVHIRQAKLSESVVTTWIICEDKCLRDWLEMTVCDPVLCGPGPNTHTLGWLATAQRENLYLLQYIHVYMVID